MDIQPILEFISAHWLELTGAAISLLWVYLEYRASMWLWPVGIVLPIFYIAISWKTAFYGNILVNVYYLITSIIGWVMWLRKPKDSEDAELPITHIPRQVFLYSVLSLVVLFYPLYWVLTQSGSSLPWADSIATGISLIGMVWLSKKYLQVWGCWILANALSALVFYTAGDMISTVVFLLNLGMSVLGYFNWTKMMQKGEDTSLS